MLAAVRDTEIKASCRDKEFFNSLCRLHELVSILPTPVFEGEGIHLGLKIGSDEDDLPHAFIFLPWLLTVSVKFFFLFLSRNLSSLGIQLLLDLIFFGQ